MKLEKIEGRFEPTDDGKCAAAAGGMVATAFPEATRAGVEVLELGGNAIDAACAAAFALAVCEPQASGIGGQSMAIMHHKGKTTAVDGSSRVPSFAHISRLEEKDELFSGYRATTIPSTPAVLDYLNHYYGRVPTRVILEPAIKIAKRGYRITELQHRLQVRDFEQFMEVPGQSGARYFLKQKEDYGYEPYEVGEKFRQPELAAMLERLAEKGIKDFYLGEIARIIDLDMRGHGGFLRADDLAGIPWPIERRTISRRYRKTIIHTLPPPSAGETLLLVMMMLDNVTAKFLRTSSPERYHLLCETFRKAFLQRRDYPVDPALYRQLPDVKRMMKREFARELVESIRDGMDPDLPLIDIEPVEADTTHLSVMDRDGNAIGITQSIERVYGSKAAADRLGFLYNNYMTTLDRKDPSHPFYLRPGAPAWSTVAPCIVKYQKQPWMVVGSPGSERIFSTVSQFLSHVIDANCDIGEAMRRPRVHCSTGGRVSYEGDRFEDAVLDYLRDTGYKLDPREPWSFYHGAVHAVMRCQSREGFLGVAEQRRDGIAAGPD